MQSYFLQITNLYRNLWFFALVMLGIVAYDLYSLASLTCWGYFALACLLSPFVVVAIPGPVARYDKLQRLYMQGKWSDACELAEQLEKNDFKKNPPLALSMRSWQARALVRLGQADRAFALMDQAPQRDEVPEWIYLHEYANVYGSALNLQQVIECYLRVVEVAPENPTGWLGLAETYAARMQRPVEARQALERLKALPKSTMLSDGLDLIEGAIAVAENRFSEAIQRLEKFRAAMQKMLKATPITLAAICEAEALLAIAYTRQGDRETGLNYYKSAAPVLRLHRVNDLLDRCAEVIPEARE